MEGVYSCHSYNQRLSNTIIINSSWSALSEKSWQPVLKVLVIIIRNYLYYYVIANDILNFYVEVCH